MENLFWPLKSEATTRLILKYIPQLIIERLIRIYEEISKIELKEYSPDLPEKELADIIKSIGKLYKRGWLENGESIVLELIEKIKASRNFRTIVRAEVMRERIGGRGRPAQTALNILVHLLARHFGQIPALSRKKWKYLADFLSEQQIEYTSDKDLKKRNDRNKEEDLKKKYYNYLLFSYLLVPPTENKQPTLSQVFGAYPLPHWEELLPKKQS